MVSSRRQGTIMAAGRRRRRGHCGWVTLVVLVGLVVGTGPGVKAALTSESDGVIWTNDLTQVIRAEVRAGIREEYSKQMQNMSALTKQRQESQFNELLTDLTVLLISYKDQAQGQGDALTSGSSSWSSLRTLSEKIDNMTTSLAGCTRRCGKSEEVHLPQSCADLRTAGHVLSGIYTITPKGWGPVRVHCDMTTDGGGWMLFQRRTNDSVDFYREWLEYANGFGDVAGSHWLGLRLLHHMTHTEPQELKVHLADFDGNSRYANYDFVAVSSEFSKFRLDLGSYTGNAGDALAHSRDHRFSTKDRDNDNHPNEHCSVRYTGGWWYNSCYRANLNGRYLQGQHRRNQGITWNMWLGDAYSLQHTAMMIRPAGFKQ